MPSHERRQPEATALYQSIAQHWPSFAEKLEEQGGLPKFVRDEFEAYLKCGLPEHGCLELCCRRCGHSMLVAFSCKRRDFARGVWEGAWRIPRYTWLRACRAASQSPLSPPPRAQVA